MRESFCAVCSVDNTSLVRPNPERRALDKQTQAARVDLAKLEREYGAAAPNVEQRRSTMRSFKIAVRPTQC